MLAALGALLSSSVVASAVSSGVNYAAQQEANELGYKMNQENNWLNAVQNFNSLMNQRNMQRIQFDQTRQLIDEEREYNSPSSQVQRYLDAGINPLGAMSNGQLGSGNASAISPSSSSSPSMIPMQAFHPNAPMLNGVAEGVGESAGRLIEGWQTWINQKRAAAQNSVDFASVDQIKAQTRNIESGRIRAEELHTFQLKEIQAKINAINGDTPEKRALIKNLQVRTSVMVLEGQKVVSDMVSKVVELENQQFGLQIQRAGMDVQAQKLQAEIYNMSYQDRLDLAFKTATHLNAGRSDSSSESSRLGLEAGLNLGVSGSASTPTLSAPIGQASVSGNVGLDLGASWSRANSTTQENSLAFSRYQFEEKTLKPALLQLQLMEDFKVHYDDPRIGRAIELLSNFTNIISPVCFQNYITLQKQFEALNSATNNPSGVDTYR